MPYVLCCGREQDTRFCCECGKRLASPVALADLLAYCRRWQLAAERRAEAKESWAAEPKTAADRKARLSKRAAAIRRQAAKWQAWADALAALLDGKGETP